MGKRCYQYPAYLRSQKELREATFAPLNEPGDYNQLPCTKRVGLIRRQAARMVGKRDKARMDAERLADTIRGAIDLETRSWNEIECLEDALFNVKSTVDAYDEGVRRLRQIRKIEQHKCKRKR